MVCKENRNTELFSYIEQYRSEQSYFRKYVRALAGAIFLDYMNIDSEMFYVTVFLSSLFNEFINWEDILQDDNFKDILVHYLQKNHQPVTHYTEIQ